MSMLIVVLILLGYCNSYQATVAIVCNTNFFHKT